MAGALYKRLDETAFLKYDPRDNSYAVVPADRVPPLRVAAEAVRLAQPAAKPDPAADFRKALVLAMLEFQHRAHEKGEPEAADPYLQVLAHLARDPEAAQKVRMGHATPAPRKFGCAYIPLRGKVGDQLLRLGAMVRDEDLADDGRETEPHVTVRYGLHTDNIDDVLSAMTGSGSVEMRFGKVSVFPGADSGKDYDVLKVDVDSPDLHRLHDDLGRLPHTDTHAEYHPHATIAYVRAGLGKKYAAAMPPLDMTERVGVATYSNAEKKRGTIRLSWVAVPTTRGNYGVKAVGQAEHVGRVLYGKAAQAALARGNKPGRVPEQRVRDRIKAWDILTRAPKLAGGLSDQDIADLATHMPALPLEKLRKARILLDASWGGQRLRKQGMIDRLMDHVRGHVEQEMDAAGMAPENPDEEIQPEVPDGHPPARPEPGKVYNVGTEHLHVDPARFQFKQKVDPTTGVTKELANVKKFNPDFAGVISAWRDPNNGKDYVVNGHHRFELARRTGYPHLAVRYLDAKDEREARAKGALINLAEGRGTAMDAAKFMRDMGVTADALAGHGVSLDGALARDAVTLTKLNDHAFERVARGQLEQDTALAVAKHLHDPDRQEKLFGLLAKKDEEGKEPTRRAVEEMARHMAAAPSARVEQQTLWGTEATDEDTFLERAELAGHVRNHLAKEHGDYSVLASQRRAEATKGAGNVLNVDENEKRAAAAAEARDLYDKHAHLKGAVADALDAGAVAIKQAKGKKEKERVRSETLETVRRALADKSAQLRGAKPAQPAQPAPAGDAGGTGGVVPGRAQGGGTEPPAHAQAGQGAAAPDAGRGGDRAAGVADWVPRYRELQNRMDVLREEGKALPPAEAAELKGLHARLMEEVGRETPRAEEKPAAPKIVATPGLSPEEAEVERRSQEHAHRNYGDIRAKYLAENGAPDGKGGHKSVVLNTDAWRDHLPGYDGTNAHAVHEAASTLNNRLYLEMLREQKGKGNGRMLVLAGGGGSGKGTATRDYFDEHGYPIVLDQVSGNLEKLEKKLDEAKAHGYEPEYVFIDRPADDAYRSVVNRALYLGSKGRLPRTVPIDRALSDNTHARKVALALLEKRQDVRPQIVDNRGGAGLRRLITDRAEAIAYLKEQIAADEAKTRAGLRDHLADEVLARHGRGEIPRNVARGLLGHKEFERRANNLTGEGHGQRVPGREPLPADHAGRADAAAAADDRRDQPGRAGADEAARPTPDGQPGGGPGRTPGEAARPVGPAYDPAAREGQPPPKDKPVTLIYGGSFSPFHTGHLDVAARKAREYMESQGYKVAKVVVAPSADKLLRAKLGDELVPLHHRTEMIRRSIQDIPDLEATSGPGEEAENFQGKLKRTQLADWAAKNYPGTTIVNVTGEDAVPPGAPAHFPSAFAGAAGSSHEGYYYVAMARPADSLSSGKVRRAVKEGKEIPAEWMHPDAAAYYRKYLEEKGQAAKPDEPPAAEKGASPAAAAPDTGEVLTPATPGQEPKADSGAPATGALGYHAQTLAREMIEKFNAGTIDMGRLAVDRDTADKMVRTLADAETYYQSIKKPRMAAAAREVIDELRNAHDFRPFQAQHPESAEGGEPGGRGRVRVEATPGAAGPEPAPEQSDDGISASAELSSPEVVRAYKRHWTGYASTQKGGFLSEYAYGNTKEEAEANARRELQRKLDEREAAKSKQAPAATAGGAAPEQPGKPAHVALAGALADKLNADEDLDVKDLWEHADRHFGGTRAEGKYGPSDAYDALEAGVNKFLAGQTDPTAGLAEAQERARQLSEFVTTLPTQTNRSGNKDAFQQFSTPPHYAFAAAWAANLRPGEHVLEPSAGTGSIAVHAKNAGATVHANELDPKRADFLKDMLGRANVHVEDAEQIAGILPKRGVAPTAVVMNPPFSQTAGRMGDKKVLETGARHIEEALRLLAPGGRLVAIVGRGMAPDSARFRDWFQKIGEKYNLRANVGVSGDEYKKYGTHFGTRLLVIDKTEPAGAEPVTGEAEDVPDLMAKLEGVRNDRHHPTPGQQGGPGGPEGARGAERGAGGAAADARAGVPAPEPGGAGRVPVGARGAGADADGGPAGGAAGAPGGRPGGAGVGVGAEPAAGPERGPGGPPGRAGGAPAREGDAAGGRKGARGKPVRQPAASVPELRRPAPVTLEPAARPAAAAPEPAGGAAAAPRSNADLGDSLYEQYRPALVRVAGARPHPTPLVESAAMASVRPPQPTYQPVLSPDVVEKGMLSEAALESLVYAGQAHGKFLPAAEGEPQFRRGYFIGDGTGAGKGRQVAGIVADNWNQGRRKHVWVSQKQTLHEDARRDWADVGMDPAQVVRFDKLRDAAQKPAEGIAFVTYDTLKSRPKDPTAPSNLDELAAWLGPDFEGVIAFDEAHTMANAIASKGSRGMKDASERALAGIKLQQMFPKARVVYVSATGATEVSNLAYAERLGLWGRGTPFPTKQHFIDQMNQGGVAAMEAVAQSIKAMGGYNARSLSFDDGTETGRVTYDRLTHSLTADQKATYDALADGWQSVLQNIDKALEATGANDSGMAKAAARSQFWGAQQRFFNQIMTAMQTPSVIKSIEKDLAEGRAPVVQLVNTMEAATKRAAARRHEEDSDDLEDMDVSPREVLMQYLEKSFPVHRYEKYVDENGNESARLVKDANGEPVVDPEAAAIRDRLMDMVGTLRIPESPLDMIVNHFGHEAVAECTGRTQRLVYKEQEDGTRKRVLERRSATSANTAEAQAFQGGEKKMLVFSDAGGTGRSYHADRTAKNQAQRVHYMLQPGWRADNAVQGLGRTHRTNQAQAPTYRLVEIDQLKAQKRFISTIARRLDQLGALTRGQRQAGSSGLFKAADNLESPQAKEALQVFFRDLERGQIEGMPYRETMKQLGFRTDDDDKKEKETARRGQSNEQIPMSQFLNRLLSLRVDMQGKVFEEYERRLESVVERAVREGTLDTGVENFPADKIARKAEHTVYRDPDSGAEARLFVATAKRKTEKRAWARNTQGELPLKFVKNDASGQVWAVYKAADKTDATTGRVIPQYVLRGPKGSQFRATYELDGYNSNFTDLDHDEAKALWDEEYKAVPEHYETTEHFLTGAFLPIWDRIPGKDRPRIYRVRTEDGQTTVGRHVPAAQVEALMKNLGVHFDREPEKPADVHGRLQKGLAAAANLANGWKLKAVRVQGERRIELVGPSWQHAEELRKDGVRQERINYDTRFFVPVGEDGAKVLERITRTRPITDVIDAKAA
jgi:predicted RNA methylase/2'-5' RNA ligase